MQEIKKYFLTFAKPQELSDGSDFFLDVMNFFKLWGYTVINTRKKGNATAYFKEILLLAEIPKRAEIITTWPGFPRLVLKDRLFFNLTRYIIFVFFKWLKKWNYSIIVIDLPVLRSRKKLNPFSFKLLDFSENFLFTRSDKIISCGSVMYELLKAKHKGPKHIQIDLYDQILPFQPSVEKSLPVGIIQVAVLGNLSRMIGNLDEFPQNPFLHYTFVGPGGESLKDIPREDITYLGVLEKDILLKELNHFHFGLINYSDEVAEYFANVIAGKVTTYILAGLPIVCPRKYTSMAELIERKKLGVCIETLEDLNILDKINSIDYLNFQKNCRSEQEGILNGLHYFEALN